MADTYTTNLKLTKPGYDSLADIAVINSNMDKIDAAYKTVDAAKLGGKPPEAYNAVNLLDNSNFVNPVNQRALRNYTYSTSPTYTIDRWHLWSTGYTMSVVSGGIQFSNNLAQKLEASKVKNGKTYTVAVGLADGTIYCYSGIADITGNTSIGSWDSVRLYYSTANLVWYVTFYNGLAKKTIAWVALYEGAYTAETLPPYTPKPYTVELAECQRYYENSWFGVDKTALYQILGAAWSTSNYDCPIYFNQEKRTTPVMTYYPTGNNERIQGYINTGNSVAGYRDVTILASNTRLGYRGIYARVNVSEADLIPGDVYQLHAHWEAVADL